MKSRRSLIAILIFLLSVIRLSAQEKSSQVDSLVRLLSAQSMQLIEKDGIDYRKVTGPARFLHNDTYLICDTALWNVATNEIYAISNVKILQDQTVLTGDRLTYYVDRSLAEFRGSIVQLEDKDHNILRTEYLDYNTKDSVAVFFNGGSMKDKEGQVIESSNGTYDSKTKVFTFTDNVNMFTDSVFVKSTTMTYDASRNKAVFGVGTDAWSNDNMLSSNAGWYDRNKEIFLFNKNVHGMSATQEGWADSLFYYRNTKDIELLGNAQVMDTTRDMSAVAGRMHYTDSSSMLEMTRKPAVIGVIREDGKEPENVYFGADTLIAKSLMAFQINESERSNSKARLDALAVDAVQAYRQKAAKEAAEAAAKAAENDPNRPKPVQQKSDAGLEKSSKNLSETLPEPSALPTDSLSVAPDSLNSFADSLKVSADTLSVQKDTVSVSLDSTKIDFITALKNVKLYKSDFQIVCDSLEYNGLDSLVRMYKNPVVWNETNRQYSADSLYAVIKNNSLQKASLMSNAFIIVQEDSLCFDQIRATEMLAYFDTTGALSRFDALGDANAVFYIQEDSVYATVNKSEAKMLYAVFKDSNLDRVYYFESTKNDGYPVAQMTREERVLKGFNWLPDKRPRGKEDITPLKLRDSQRKMYASRPKTVFNVTDKYFPGYMPGVYKKIEKGKIAKANADARKSEACSVMVPADTSLAIVDSTMISSPTDSLVAPAPADTLINKSDSLLSVVDSTMTAVDTAMVPVKDAKAEKAAQRAAKIAAREARWAALDSLDAAKAQAKADKKAAEIRKKKLKQLKAAKAEEDKENARLERYKTAYQKKKDRRDRKSAAKITRDIHKRKEASIPKPDVVLQLDSEDIISEAETQ